MGIVADGVGDWQQLPASGAGGKHRAGVMAVLESLREAAVGRRVASQGSVEGP